MLRSLAYAKRVAGWFLASVCWRPVLTFTWWSGIRDSTPVVRNLKAWLDSGCLLMVLGASFSEIRLVVCRVALFLGQAWPKSPGISEPFTRSTFIELTSAVLESQVCSDLADYLS
eukprot:s4369_g9.t1